MSAEPTLTIVGNLTDDPELRFTSNGVAVANFTVANTSRILDRDTGQWRDGEPLFLRCTAWRQSAENAGETLTKGSRVIVTGRLRQRSYDTGEGDKRTVIELDVDELGASVRYATATITKNSFTTTAAAGGTSS
jgi:single-strand DNA-binding protein